MDKDKYMIAYYLYKKDIAKKCGINYDRLNEDELRILREQMKKEERNDEYIARCILKSKSDEFVSLREIREEVQKIREERLKRYYDEFIHGKTLRKK